MLLPTCWSSSSSSTYNSSSSSSSCMKFPWVLKYDGRKEENRSSSSRVIKVIEMRDKTGKNRKPLQRGRIVSTEAIQTIQALKRYNKSSEPQLLLRSKFGRLLKLDMMAVLRELLRQDQSYLALLVFEEIQKEYWYKPQVSIYTQIISVLLRNGLFDKVDLLFHRLKTQKDDGLEANTQAFNALLETLMSFDITGLAMECFELMKSVGCEPDRSTFKLLVYHLESKGENALSASIRKEAHEFYGASLEFLDKQEDVSMS